MVRCVLGSYEAVAHAEPKVPNFAVHAELHGERRAVTEKYAGSPRLQSREECEKRLLCLRRIMTS